jgi:hypothetical protein
VVSGVGCNQKNSSNIYCRCKELISVAGVQNILLQVLQKSKVEPLPHVSQRTQPVALLLLQVYERELNNLTTYLKLATRPMFWTANVSAIANMEKNWEALEAQMDLAGGRDKFKPMLGIYMWDYLTNKTVRCSALSRAWLCSSREDVLYLLFQICLDLKKKCY